MAMKFKEGDRVRVTREANYEGWFFREGDEGEIAAVFPIALHPFHIKFTKHSDYKYVGYVGACAEHHIELISRPGEKAAFDHNKERAQIANANIDWFNLNEEFSSK